MDVYLKRTYDLHNVQCSGSQANYPFWDYRSVRHSSSLSSLGDKEGNLDSFTENTEMPGCCHNTLIDTSTFNLELCPVTLHVITDPHQVVPLLDLYQEVVNHVDPDLRLFHVTQRRNEIANRSQDTAHSNGHCSDIPAIALTIFCRGADEDGDQNDDSNERLEEIIQLFQHHPWRFHHSEKLNQTKINPVHNDSQHFYYTSHDLPLWSARPVHYGREHIRYGLYTSDISWPEQVQFYRIIFGLEPDLLREDFCLFTIYTQDNYDVQFTLKKLAPNLRTLTLQSVHIHVKVNDADQIVSLLPNVCRPTNDGMWQTTDHDGNVIVLDISPVSFPIQKQTTTHHHHHSLAVNIDPHSTSEGNFQNQQETQSYIINNDIVAKRQCQVPELSMNLLNIRCSYNQRLDNSVLSDCEDFGIDLPSPPLRYSSKQEEDVESLTLTNTSEESGIQMQHGSDDSSFNDDDGLRSCLSKNSSLKVRHVKFKVRFKEEVDAFSIGSEEYSDSEMETRFPHIPTSLEKQSYCEGRSVEPSRLTCTDNGRISPFPMSLTNVEPYDNGRVTPFPMSLTSGTPYNNVPARSRSVSPHVPCDTLRMHNFRPNSVSINSDRDYVSRLQARNNKEMEAISNTAETKWHRQETNSVTHSTPSRLSSFDTTHCTPSRLSSSDTTHCNPSRLSSSDTTHNTPSRLSNSDTTHCPPSRLSNSDTIHCPPHRVSMGDSNPCSSSRISTSDLTHCSTFRRSKSDSTHSSSSRILLYNAITNTCEFEDNACIDHQCLRTDSENLQYHRPDSENLQYHRLDSENLLCRNCSHHQNHTCTSMQRTLSLNKTRSSSLDPVNKQHISSRSQSENIVTKCNQNRQHKNRTTSSANIHKKELLPSTLSTTVNKSKHVVGVSNSSENKTQQENREKKQFLFPNAAC